MTIELDVPPEPPSGEPPSGQPPGDAPRRKPAWLVTVAVLLVLPLSAVTTSLLAAAEVLRRQGHLDGLEQALRALPERGVTVMVVGLLGSATAMLLVLALVPRNLSLARLLREQPRPRLLDALIVTAGMLGLASVLEDAIWLSGLEDFGALGMMRDTFEALTFAEKLAMLPFIAVVAGTLEEVFFRGYVLNELEALRGPRAALIASAAAFGLVHFDPVHSPTAMVMGLYLGLAYLATRSLWTVAGAHVLNNAVATFSPSLFPDTHLAHAISAVVGTAIAASAALWLRKRSA